MCEIFALAALSGIGFEEAAYEEPAPPWYLGQICRAWRTSALTYPALWCLVTITHRDQPLIETQLLRSAHAQLEVHWTDTGYHDFPNQHVLDSVLARCSRWKSLLVNSVDGSLDSLEKLVIVNGASAQIRDVFLSAPKLRQVVLAEWDGFFSPSIDIPWSQITHYRGSFPVMRQLEILQAAPNLVQCVVGFQLCFGDSHTEVRVILPHLRRLWMYIPDNLCYFITPLLEDLFCGHCAPEQLACIPPLVQTTNSCSLKKLALMECTICSELISVLRGLPLLESLIIETPSFIDADDTQEVSEVALLEAMTLSPGSSHLCPNLTFIGYGFGDDFAVDQFFAMVESRFRCPNPRLSTVRLFRAHYVKAERPHGMDSWTGKLGAAGFDVAFLDGLTLRVLQTSGCFPDFSFD
ncbi:hypothetical protein DFH06DRAFT_1203331 [Mycena polygramma]|nr:hypothetical protein DFH06DRAFT_1203331 [Mycena polygramma]